jgi:hypothetical protein
MPVRAPGQKPTFEDFGVQSSKRPVHCETCREAISHHSPKAAIARTRDSRLAYDKDRYQLHPGKEKRFKSLYFLLFIVNLA